MNKPTTNEIWNLLDYLIGETNAVGESNIDNEIYDNLVKLIEITDLCLDKISYASLTSNRHEYSMRKIGRKALQYFAESAQYFNSMKKRWDNEDGITNNV